MNHKLIIEDDLQWKMTPRVQIYPTMVCKKLWRSNKGMKWSYENISTWSSDWPKEWLFSVQSSSTNGASYTQAILRKIRCYSVWIDTHLLEMRIETNYGFKRWPVPSQNQGVPHLNPKKKPRLPTKVSFKGGSPPRISQPILLSSLSKSRGRDFF
jgi:hypothetical protein